MLAWLNHMALPTALGIFVACSIVIGIVGTRLTHVVDDLADRTGLGEAIAGAVLLGMATSLSGIVLSTTAAWGDRPELAMSNALGGIAVQTLFLTIAANRAIALGMRTVVTGVCQMDNANYPDCRMEFIKMMEGAINAALGISDFYISTPLISRAKDDTVRLAHSMPKTWEAMAYTHTCYAGTFPPCGKCHACVLRAEGFARAGLFDPLIKRALA